MKIRLPADIDSGFGDLQVIPSPRHSRSLSKSSDGTHEHIADDHHTEATFSDDEESAVPFEASMKKSRYEDHHRGEWVCASWFGIGECHTSILDIDVVSFSDVH